MLFICISRHTFNSSWKSFFKKFKGTGWSKETVNCNFFLTDPKKLKNAKTQWFLETLDREVLLFWCFKSVRWMQFCLSEIFQYWAFAAPYKAWTLIYTIWQIKTKKHRYTSLKRSQTPLPDIYGQFRTTKVTDRHQQTPKHIPRHPKGCLRMCDGSCWGWMAFAGVCWCLLVSDNVLCCLEGVWMSEEFLKGYLSAVYGRV